MTRLGHLGNRLYRGDVSYDFVGRRKTWYIISALILIVSLAGLIGPGLHLGIEFKGGTVFQFAAAKASAAAVRDAVTDAGAKQVIVQKAGDAWRVQTESLEQEQVNKVQQAIASEFSINSQEVSQQVIGPTWGGEISKKALQALILFLILVVIYLSMAFEFKMAMAAIVALAHDLFITTGVYAWSGFEVTPATVIGLLTILGYSLYDTVVVFDKVRENTAPLLGGARMTYSQAANLAVNQTLVRSINTSVIALLPVASILIISTTLLGTGPLKDLALALFVGIAAGTYSSVCIATPLLADLKEREPQYQALAKRIAARTAPRQAEPKVKLAKGRPGGGRLAAATEGPRELPAAQQEPGEEAAQERPAAATVGLKAERRVQQGPRHQPKRGGKKSGGKKKKKR